MMNDPFAVLGVPSSATEDEIKAAYRKLAKKYHPDLNPGDKAAEQKMREVNEAYTEALRIKKGGGTSSGGAYGSPWGSYGPYGQQPWGQQQSSGPRYEYRDPGQRNASGNPFGDFGYDPFSAFFGGGYTRQEPSFRSRTYAHPDMQAAAGHIRAGRYAEAASVLNRIPTHDADWHALYARVDLATGNRISALDHAQLAVRMSHGDPEYEALLNTIQSGRRSYRETRDAGGYDFKSMICSNPCVTCLAINILLNCCLGGCGRGGRC